MAKEISKRNEMMYFATIHASLEKLSAGHME